MNRHSYWITTALGALACLLVATAATLHATNADLRARVGERQNYVQQSVQLEGLYREIVRALAELGARHNDGDMRALLSRHGITYNANPAAPAPAPAAPPSNRK